MKTAAQQQSRRGGSRSRSSAPKTKRGSAKRSAPEDAIAMLKADHEKVSGMLEKLEKARTGDARQKLVEQIAEEVRLHSTLEEEIFYPAFLDAVEKKEETKLYYEAFEEHHLVDTVLAEIDEEDPDSEEYAAKGKVLKDLIEHHVEEEEGEMFPKARKAMGAEELREIGERMMERKAALQGAPASSSDDEEMDAEEDE